MGRRMPGRVAAAAAVALATRAAALCALATLGIATTRLATPATAAAEDSVPIDGIQTLEGWSVSTSSGARAWLSCESGEGGMALRLDYDMPASSGFVILRRAVRLTLPDNFAFLFRMRAEAPPANFEFKVVDGRGRNVWWRRWPGLSFSRDWQRMVVRKSRLAFAWGPDSGPPRDVGALEIALSGGEGGSGTLWLDDLEMEPREPAGANGRPTAQASSARAGSDAALAVDDSPETRWRSEPDQEAQWLQLDFGRNREYGGLAIDWDPVDFATDYAVSVSSDGNAWTEVHRTDTGKDGRQYVYMPDSESRYVRLDLRGSSRGRGYAIGDIAVKPVEFSESPNAFFAAIAYDAPAGTYPKYLHGQQTYWTVVGVERDGVEALVNEEGMVEVDRAFSLEPFLFVGGKLITWHDVEVTQELEQGSLPMPSVVWRRGALTLRVTAFAAGPPGASTLYLRYRIENGGAGSERVRLYVTIRPFQVLPPWQSLNVQGGVAPIRELRWDDRAVWIDRSRRVVPLVAPSGFGAATFEDGSVPELLMFGQLPDHREVNDPFGFASGAFEFPFRLGAAEAGEVALAVPLHSTPPDVLPDIGLAGVAALQDQTRLAWTRMLGRVEIALPPQGAPLLRTLRSTIGYVLVNQDGPALRPGARNYARSWIRDGAATSEAMLQMGFTNEVREFVRWYASFQASDGRIPCCIDRRGPDWTPEHDSVGNFIYALAEYYRFTRDASFVNDLWPDVVRGVDHLNALRAQRMTREYRDQDRIEFYGLLPESISHEGYSGHPVHSYWDDFFALRGLKDAAALAVVVGDDEHAREYAQLRDDFRATLLASLAATMARHQIDYLPGSAELGDFDPTSTSIAIVPGGELERLPPDAVRRTFERYWGEIEQRIRGEWAGEAYSPYELRNVGTFLRLGWPGRAHALLDFIMGDRRPAAWNEWAEVVWRQRSLPRFIGDMPHTWVGAGFVQAVRAMMAYEREFDQALVIAAGVREDWLATGVGVRRLPTHWGVLNYTMQAAGPDRVRLRLSGDIAMPPGRIDVLSPLARPVIAATVNGRPVDSRPDGVLVETFPADVELRYDRAAR